MYRIVRDVVEFDTPQDQKDYYIDFVTQNWPKIYSGLQRKAKKEGRPLEKMMAEHLDESLANSTRVWGTPEEEKAFLIKLSVCTVYYEKEMAQARSTAFAYNM